MASNGDQQPDPIREAEDAVERMRVAYPDLSETMLRPQDISIAPGTGSADETVAQEMFPSARRSSSSRAGRNATSCPSRGSRSSAKS